MSPLMAQFLSESRECLQGIGEKLMRLEHAPQDAALMNELFRLVHTLKGNSGLFDFRDMSRVLHAGEDLMDGVRNGQVAYSQALADQLLDAMDFVSMLCDEIESEKPVAANRATESARLAEALRALIPAAVGTDGASAVMPSATDEAAPADGPRLTDLPDAVRREAWRRSQAGESLHWIAYRPAADCFFQGEDPFHTARQTPDCLWRRISPREAWPPLAEFDAYQCMLNLDLLTTAPAEELAEHYRYVPEQVRITAIAPRDLMIAAGEAPDVAPPIKDLDASDTDALQAIFSAQRQILMLEDRPAWHPGRLRAAANVLSNCCQATGNVQAQRDIALVLASGGDESEQLLAWLRALDIGEPTQADVEVTSAPPTIAQAASVDTREAGTSPVMPEDARRSEDAAVIPKSLKVDQAKIDLLMDLIGEMVVSKNALPYLAQRAETHFGMPELAREIKTQYAVINRIAEEMQSAIMQVRMMPVSFVFQRFPRLVRDLSRKLDKEVQLVLEGEDTEADKNIIESLADPLIHIVRNSLDHGLETREARRAAGKPAAGTLTIRAVQEGDQVLIDIIDDGRGIDPAMIKRKAYEKGLIDEATLERIDDREAINLVFAAGFSTADVVSDLSGRGVGMDVVRSAVEKVNGKILLESDAGKGTRIRISLPLSMAITKVMIVESDDQIFGVPMDHVVETVRVPCAAIRTIKRSKTTVLRGNIVPLKTLNGLLGLSAEPRPNADDEIAVLVARVGGESIGLIVDDFHETADVIQKPLSGVLSGLAGYSGSALMGDGSVLMVLNVKEIV